MNSKAKKNVPIELLQLWKKHESAFDGIKTKNSYFDTFVKYEAFKQRNEIKCDDNDSVDGYITDLRRQGFAATSIWSYLSHVKKCLMLLRCVLNPPHSCGAFSITALLFIFIHRLLKFSPTPPVGTEQPR